MFVGSSASVSGGPLRQAALCLAVPLPSKGESSISGIRGRQTWP